MRIGPLGFVTLVLAAMNQADACTVADGGFRQFFERFSDDHAFQLERMEPTVKMGYYKEIAGRERRIWREFPPERIVKIYGNALIPKSQERRRGYETRFGATSGSTAAVRVLKKESDTFVVTFFFRNTDGCWNLYGIQDDSNLEWKL